MIIFVSDFDYTLSKGYSSIELFKSLEKDRIIKTGFTKGIDKMLAQYLSNQISYDEGMEIAYNLMSIYITGMKETELIKYIKESFHPEQYIFPWVNELTHLLKERDILFVVISATIGQYIESTYDQIQYSSALTNNFVVYQGKFTSEYNTILNNEKKGLIIDDMKIGGNKIIAMGDSEGDIDMLENSDIGILYKPKQRLLDKIGGKFINVNESSVIPKVKEAIAYLSQQ